MKKDNFIKYLKKHNPKALDYVFKNYGNLIFKMSYYILNNRTLSEECVNDVLFKIWNNISQFDGDEEKFKNWIMVMTRYAAIDKFRKEEKHSKNSDIDNYEINDNSFEESLEHKETRNEIFNEILKFDDINKEIFIKRFFLEYSLKEISRDMKISENAVSTRILRGRKKLIEKLHIFKTG